jgi:hypothetical protein
MMFVKVHDSVIFTESTPIISDVRLGYFFRTDQEVHHQCKYGVVKQEDMMSNGEWGSLEPHMIDTLDPNIVIYKMSLNMSIKNLYLVFQKGNPKKHLGRVLKAQKSHHL